MGSTIAGECYRTGCVYVAELNGRVGLPAVLVAVGVAGAMTPGVTDTAGIGAITGADGATVGV